MCYLLKKYFWWLLRRVKNLRSTACKHYRKCDVIYRYLQIELIWCLLMVKYLQNNVIMKSTTRFIRFTGWIPLKYGSITTPPIIAHCQKTPMSTGQGRPSFKVPPRTRYVPHSGYGSPRVEGLTKVSVYRNLKGFFRDFYFGNHSLHHSLKLETRSGKILPRETP